MEQTFRQIQCLAEDIRLNTYDDDVIKQYKLRTIEDLCIRALMILNDIRHGDN